MEKVGRSEKLGLCLLSVGSELNCGVWIFFFHQDIVVFRMNLQSPISAEFISKGDMEMGNNIGACTAPSGAKKMSAEVEKGTISIKNQILKILVF